MRSKKPLGRCRPKDMDHVEKYPLLLSTVPAKPVPVVLGIDWHANFDTPVRGKDRRWRIGQGNLGPIRGGHAIVIPADNSDLYSWYLYFNQLAEGACVGFAISRMMALLNREKYDGFKLYYAAKQLDEYPGDAYDGTSLRAGLDVTRTTGPYCPRKKIFCNDDGIVANRWARDVVEVMEALKNPAYLAAGEIPLHNSWGKEYPQRVWMPIEILAKLLERGGEAGIVTDK